MKTWKGGLNQKNEKVAVKWKLEKGDLTTKGVPGLKIWNGGLGEWRFDQKQTNSEILL